MLFDVTIQGQFYKTIEARNTGAALSKVSADIKSGAAVVDPAQPHNIRISRKAA